MADKIREAHPEQRVLITTRVGQRSPKTNKAGHGGNSDEEPERGKTNQELEWGKKKTL